MSPTSSSRSLRVALAHRVGNAVSRAYARSDLLERRRPIMSRLGELRRGQERHQRGGDQGPRPCANAEGLTWMRQALQIGSRRAELFLQP